MLTAPCLLQIDVDASSDHDHQRSVLAQQQSDEENNNNPDLRGAEGDEGAAMRGPESGDVQDDGQEMARDEGEAETTPKQAEARPKTPIR